VRAGAAVIRQGIGYVGWPRGLHLLSKSRDTNYTRYDDVKTPSAVDVARISIWIAVYSMTSRDCHWSNLRRFKSDRDEIWHDCSWSK